MRWPREVTDESKCHSMLVLLQISEQKSWCHTRQQHAILPLELTGSDNNSIRPHQTADHCKSTAIHVVLTSEVDRIMQWKTSRERAEGVTVIAKERWGKQTTPETEGGIDVWNWGEDLTADQSGRLQGGCLVLASDFSLYSFPFLSQLQQAFLHLRLPGKFTPSTPLYPGRNTANSESSLITSSTSQHLAMPLPLKEWLHFINFILSNYLTAVE